MTSIAVLLAAVAATPEAQAQGYDIGLGEDALEAYTAAVVPTIGLVRTCGPRVAPVAIGGQDAGGRLWSGVGLQIRDF